MYACMTPVGFDTSDKFENHCYRHYLLLAPLKLPVPSYCNTCLNATAQPIKGNASIQLASSFHYSLSSLSLHDIIYGCDTTLENTVLDAEFLFV